jgi:putative PIN family toxin of toxin-antitoxin system
MRVVVDTNVILSSLKDPKSAAARVVSMCLSGELQPVGSFKTKQEAARLAMRSGVRKEDWIRVDRLLYRTLEVVPTTRFDISTDRSDNLMFEAAHGGGAQYIITNDHHLLEHNGYWGIAVLRPGDFIKKLAEMKK